MLLRGASGGATPLLGSRIFSIFNFHMNLQTILGTISKPCLHISGWKYPHAALNWLTSGNFQLKLGRSCSFTHVHRRYYCPECNVQKLNISRAEQSVPTHLHTHSRAPSILSSTTNYFSWLPVFMWKPEMSMMRRLAVDKDIGAMIRGILVMFQ